MDICKFKAGDEVTYARLITREDILKFADISHDRGFHHINLESRLLAHGLLIASLPTKLGGDMNYIAQTMEFQFLKPVYEGEMITCIGKIEKIREQERRFKTELSFRCTKETGEIIMTGYSKGFIWKQA